MEKKILLIDNDSEMEDLFREIFIDGAYTIFYHEETEDVITLIKQCQPHIVILDYNLNGLNGGELCRQIKNDDEVKDMPVILCSGFPKAIYALENYGYDAFVEKPFDIDEIQDLVDELVETGN